jgi:hypothetical protein
VQASSRPGRNASIVAGLPAEAAALLTPDAAVFCSRTRTVTTPLFRNACIERKSPAPHQFADPPLPPAWPRVERAGRLARAKRSLERGWSPRRLPKRARSELRLASRRGAGRPAGQRARRLLVRRSRAVLVVATVAAHEPGGTRARSPRAIAGHSCLSGVVRADGHHGRLPEGGAGVRDRVVVLLGGQTRTRVILVLACGQVSIALTAPWSARRHALRHGLSPTSRSGCSGRTPNE